MYHAPMFIGGRTVDATAASPFEVVNPATEERLGLVAAAGPDEVEAALTSSRRAFAVWRDTPPWTRSLVLRRIAALVRLRADVIATLLTLEIGKPLAESRVEVLGSADYFDWFAEEARRIYGYSLDGRTPGSRFDVTHAPLGVTLALTAWNFPVSLAARKLSAALAAGCSVILRPASEAPACVAELVRCCHDADLPEGTVNLLFGEPDDIVAPLMAAPSVRKVSFTGSTRVGQILIAQSAQTVKKLTLELGGHAPFIVLDDADIEQAASAAVAGKFRNAGQVCTAPTRFFVHERVHDAFVERFTARASEIVLGDGLADGVTMGPVASPRQRDRTERLVADARAKGARIELGGSRPAGINRGYFFEPTIMSNLPDDAAALTEEPFAPLAAIVRVNDEAEAVTRANALEYGLAGYVFGRSGRRLDVIASLLEVGVTGVNTIAVAVPEMPFGGLKQSGLGREGGPDGIMEYLQPKFVHRVPS